MNAEMTGRYLRGEVGNWIINEDRQYTHRKFRFVSVTFVPLMQEMTAVYDADGNYMGTFSSIHDCVEDYLKNRSDDE